MTRREQRIGKAGEERVASVLSMMGVEEVERVATPVLLVPTRLKGAFRVIWSQPVSGDHHGILPGGRSVRAETKTIFDRNLQWSDLRPHQPPSLSRHAELGGLSLLVWVHSTGIHVMQWPIEGFGPGKGITPERAMAIELKPGDLERYFGYPYSPEPNDIA